MIRNIINEVNKLPKFSVRFSDEINDTIDDVIFLNQFEEEKLKEWHDFLDGMVSRISDPVIAWDNMNIFQHDEGIHHIQIDGNYGYDVLYTFEEDEETGTTYIYVFKANLRIRQHGLELPFGVYESQRPRKNLNEGLRRIKLKFFMKCGDDIHFSTNFSTRDAYLGYPFSLCVNSYGANFSTESYDQIKIFGYITNRAFKQIK